MDWKGILHFDNQSTLRDTAHYLDELRTGIHEKCPEFAKRKGVVFHQDSIPSESNNNCCCLAESIKFPWDMHLFRSQQNSSNCTILEFIYTTYKNNLMNYLLWNHRNYGKKVLSSFGKNLGQENGEAKYPITAWMKNAQRLVSFPSKNMFDFLF